MTQNPFDALGGGFDMNALLQQAQQMQQQLEEAQAVTFGVLAAGPLVAFLAPVVGLLALPLGLLPMMLTNVAVKRYSANRAT